ncbi:MAG TPA: hypothetical protein VFV50_06365 [Bdellovibrionales bacterium]|nr:hypothetical protein [Bdellovibrionales bacterium]
MKRILSLSIVLLLTGCGLMQRSPESGYAGQWDDVGEPSYGGRTRTLSQNERSELEGNVEIRRLESNIRSDEESDQYNRYKASMTAKERAEFLSMRDSSARRRWVQAKGIREDRGRFSRNIASVIEDGDITLGMPKEAVRESWGDPETVEVAGNPTFGNERWIYTRYISSVEGYQREERIIYFEGGQVVGWERK